MALVCLCWGISYWPPHTTILFCSIFFDKFVLDTLKSRYHRSAPVGYPVHQLINLFQQTQTPFGVLGSGDTGVNAAGDLVDVISNLMNLGA